MAFFLSLALLLTVIAIPDSPLHGSMTAYASASGDADSEYIKEDYSKQAQYFSDGSEREGKNTRGDYYIQPSFPISYLDQEEIHTITEEGSLGFINSPTPTWYQFTPTETALYTFKSGVGETCRGSIYIKNPQKECYERIAWDNYDDLSNYFQITESLQAGATYYLRASNNNGKVEIVFHKTAIKHITGRVNGIPNTSHITKSGKSYRLEADVDCIKGVTPTYEWYTLDENSNKNPLPGTGNNYTYTESGDFEKELKVYCTVKTSIDSETLEYHLSYYPRTIKLETYNITVDGKEPPNTFKYQMNRTYRLSINAESSIGSTLTYTWKIGEKTLQTGENNTFYFTPTKDIIGKSYKKFTLICEISDEEDHIETSNTRYFSYTPIADVQREVDGVVQKWKRKKVANGVPYNLKVSALAEKGKNLTYQWQTEDGSVLGEGQTYQYTMDADKSNETIYCIISDGTAKYKSKYQFYSHYLNTRLTVNGGSASGNAIPIQLGGSYQFKVSVDTHPGNTYSYEWGWNSRNFTAIPGQTGDTYSCHIKKVEDIIPDLICRVSDSEGNTTTQHCYMDYWSIYDLDLKPSVNGIPGDYSVVAGSYTYRRIGQNYTLSVTSSEKTWDNLTYFWYLKSGDTRKALSTKSSYTFKATKDKKEESITCRISDGFRSREIEFYLPLSRFDTTVYDFMINGVSTDAIYAYEGQKVNLKLVDKYGMAGDIVWKWGSDDSAKDKEQIMITMGKEVIKVNCSWDDGFTRFTLLPCTSHAYTSKVTKAATASAKGVLTDTCKKCGHTRTTSIAKVSTVKLSRTSFDYNGKNQNVSLTVKDSTGKKLTPGEDYDYTYNNKKNGKISAKNIGQYTLKVTFKGRYRGSKNLTFKILPKKIMLSKLSAVKKGFKAVWKKPANKTTGYEISYALNKSFKKKPKTLSIANYKTTSKTVKKLKARTTYYVRIRTYKNVKSGKKTIKLYSKWSSPKAVKTKK